MQVTLPDGSPLELEDGASGADAARAIGEGLARAALAFRQNGQVRDLSAKVGADAPLDIIPPKSPEALELIRHDAAHLLATAVLELHPGTRVSIGPPIEDGFYYDFEFPECVTVGEADLPRIEEVMRRHAKADEAFERSELAVGDALQHFTVEDDQPYKRELIEDLARDQGVDSVSLYRNGPFLDLCRGPHGPTTKRVKAFKLLSVPGAYGRGGRAGEIVGLGGGGGGGGGRERRTPPPPPQIYKSAPRPPRRPADPLPRGRPGPPPRAERRPPRAPARAPHHPGRRPHLLHP